MWYRCVATFTSSISTGSVALKMTTDLKEVLQFPRALFSALTSGRAPRIPPAGVPWPSSLVLRIASFTRRTIFAASDESGIDSSESFCSRTLLNEGDAGQVLPQPVMQILPDSALFPLADFKDCFLQVVCAR